MNWLQTAPVLISKTRFGWVAYDTQGRNQPRVPIDTTPTSDACMRAVWVRYGERVPLLIFMSGDK